MAVTPHKNKIKVIFRILKTINQKHDVHRFDHTIVSTKPLYALNNLTFLHIQ